VKGKAAGGWVGVDTVEKTALGASDSAHFCDNHVLIR
jgi:hypothetical protein